MKDVAGSFSRYCVITINAIGIHLGLTCLLHELLSVPEKIAVATAYVVVLVVNFVLKRFYVFKAKDGRARRQLLLYTVSSVVFRGLEYSAFLLLFDLFNIQYLIANASVLVVSFVIKFFYYGTVVFTRPKPNPLQGRYKLCTEKDRMLPVVLLLSTAALCVGLWHGLPQVYVPDTHIIRNALGMAKTMDLWPTTGTFSTYPYLLAYLLLPVYGITYAVGRVTGMYGSADDFGRAVIEDPSLVYMEARVMIAVFGVVAVYYLYRTARRLSLTPAVSAGASLFLAFNPLFVQLGHHSRPWIPIIAGICFTLYHSAGICLLSRKRDYFLASLGAGLTFAMHQVGGIALIIPVAAHMALQGRRLLSLGSIAKGVAIVLLFGIFALLAGYGHNLFGGAAVDVMPTDESNFELGGQKVVLSLFTFRDMWKTVYSLFGYDPVCITLGLVGLLWGMFRRGFKGLRFALLMYSGFVLAFFLAYNNRHIRYLLPVVPALALGAAYGADRLGRSLGLKRAWIILPLVVFSGIQTARLDYILCRTDTRDLARQWIETNIPGGTKIVAEGYTAPLEPDIESINFLKSRPGVWLKRKEELKLEGVREQVECPEYFMIPLQRFYDFKSYWPHQYRHGGERSIERFLQETGAEWIMLSDRWPRRERHAPLMEFLEKHAEAGPVFSPAKIPNPDEATLPTDMDFPLISLWTLERPGTVVSLYKIKQP